MTKWCNNFEAYKTNWSSGYKSNSRCWTCDKWTLVSNDAKNLWDWWYNGIDSDQKDKIIKFGINPSSSSNQKYPLGSLSKIYYCHDIFERNKLRVPNENQFMVFFSTWWNNNCSLIINGDSNYAINLLVYEMPSKSIPEVLKKFYVDGGFSNLESAKSKVKSIEITLKGENPILYKGVSRSINYHSYNENSSPSSFLFGIISFLFGRRNHLSSVFPEVNSITLHSDSQESELPFNYSGSLFLNNFASSNVFFDYSQVFHLLTPNYRNFLNNDPDNLIKPLDIIKTSKEKTIHTGIYLGKEKVVHNLGNGVEIIDWKNFGVRVGHPDTMTRYHPIIPFKKPEKIIEHIAKCVVNSSWGFDIMKNNCEHFANKCVYGVDLSEHVEMKKASGGQTQKQLNGSQNLLSEISQVDSRLDNSVSYTPYSKINEIESYKVYHLEGIEMECSIEVDLRHSYWYNKEIN